MIRELFLKLYIQISRFFKNLNQNQLSTSSSSITLYNLELNEDTLKTLFLLTPSTDNSGQSLIKITKAICTSASITIPWVSITTSPIVIAFDTLEITIDILDSPVNSPDPEAGLNKVISDLTSPDEEKSYGFVDKIIDGISFSLNFLNVKVRAADFSISLELTFLKANSCPPNFKVPTHGKQSKTDLRVTRIKSHGFVLLFKTISWQTLKIEAKAKRRRERRSSKDSSDPLDDEDDSDSEMKSRRRQPGSKNDVIRLISSGGSAQLSVKKCLANREVVCVKTSFILADILWLLSATSSQSRDALKLIESISSLVVTQSATSSSNLASQHEPVRPPQTSASSKGSPVKSVKVDQNSQIYKIFTQFDPVESSVHFTLNSFQLQVVDDVNMTVTSSEFHSKFPPLSAGSALLFSAEKLSFSIYPEYNAKRSFISHGVELDERETCLQLRIKISNFKIHCVGLNDSRMKSIKKPDIDDKNKYFVASPASTSPVPDDVCALDLSLIHYYDDQGGKKVDAVKVRVGPTRIYFDEPTILWIHSFVLPILAASQQMKDADQSPSATPPPYMDVEVELLFPVIVVDEKSPLSMFPSPFANVTGPITSEKNDDLGLLFTSNNDLEIKAARVILQRIRTSDHAWSLKADPVWVDMVSIHNDKRRVEIVEPISVSGTIILFPPSPVSMEEIRISISIATHVTLNVRDIVIPHLLRIIQKMDLFGDFIAQDKLHMRECISEMTDSLLSLKILLSSVGVNVWRNSTRKIRDDNNSSSTSSTSTRTGSLAGLDPDDRRGGYSVPRSASAPDDMNALAEEATSLNPSSLLELQNEQRGSSRGSPTTEFHSGTGRDAIPADLMSLDSRFSDDDDPQYILSHIQVPASISSSPSLDTKLGYADVEEAEDVSALLGDDAAACNTVPVDRQDDLEKLLYVHIENLVIEKRGTDLHSVTEVMTSNHVTFVEPMLFETSIESVTPVPSPTVEEKGGHPLAAQRDSSLETTSSIIYVRSEIAYDQSLGKQDLTSLLISRHPKFSLDTKTLDTLLTFAQAMAATPEFKDAQSIISLAQVSKTPPLGAFVQDLTFSLTDLTSPVASTTKTPHSLATIELPAACVETRNNNIISIAPVDAAVTSVQQCLMRKHRKMFGSDVVSTFPSIMEREETNTSQDKSEATSSNEETEKVLAQVLTQNQRLEEEVDNLKKENELLKKWVKEKMSHKES